MKRIILGLSCAAAAVMLSGLLSCSREEEKDNQKDLPTRFQDDEYVDVVLSTDEAVYEGAVTIKNENGKALVYTVTLLGQQDLDDYYNSVQGTDYKVIPENLYDFPDGTDVTFAQGETEKQLRYTIDVEMMFDTMIKEGESSGELPEYALPMQLVDNEGQDGSILIHCFKMKYDRMAFTSSGTHVNLEEPETKVEVSASVYSGSEAVANPYAIDAALVLPADPESWLAEFNASSDVTYSLLPQEYYSTASLTGDAAGLGSKAEFVIYRIKNGAVLPTGNYVIPLQISAESLTDIVVDPAVFAVTVTNPSHVYESAELDKTGWKVIYASNECRRDGIGGDGQGAESIIDGSFETCWWSSKNFADKGVDRTGAAFVIDLGNEQTIASTGIMHLFRNDDYWYCNKLGTITWYAATESEFISGIWKEFASYECTNTEEDITVWTDVATEEMDNGNAKGRYVKLVLGPPLFCHECVFTLNEVSLKGVTNVDGSEYVPVPATEEYLKPSGAVRIVSYDVVNNTSSAGSVMSALKPDFVALQSADAGTVSSISSATGLSATYVDNAGNAMLAGSSVSTEILKGENFEAALMETDRCIALSTSFLTTNEASNEAQVSALSKALVAKYGTHPEKPVLLFCDCGAPYRFKFSNVYYLQVWGWRPLTQMYGDTYTGEYDNASIGTPGMESFDFIFVWDYWCYDGKEECTNQQIDFNTLFTVHGDYKYPVAGTDVHYPVFMDITFK